MSDINRRRFIGSAAASGAFTIVPRHVLGGTGYVPPSDKLTMAHIGMGTQGFRELESLLASPEIQIVAVCDPNRDSNDYVEWGKNSIRRIIRKLLGNPTWQENGTGCPGGREIGRQVVDAYYARQRGAANFKACTAYADFRELLDKEKDLDAVKIMTPDHHHATISIAAMKKGLHVVMHKPIANRMYEARLVIETARRTGVGTHLLAYGSGEPNRLIAEKVKQGVIGTLREIHNWSNRPVWPQYSEIPKDRPPVPEGFDWELWLGPALDRPYHPHYTHTVFRGWYDFGGGSMADMGIYSLWPVFTALNLDAPVSAEAWPTHACAIVDHVSRPVKNDFSFPIGCRIHFKFAATAERPALDLFWYDGGMKPRLPEQIEAHDIPVAREGILFVGDQGTILAGFRGDSPQLFVGNSRKPLFEEQPSPPRAARRQTDPRERTKPWLQALLTGKPSPGSFLNAGPISDAVNLAAVALRAGGKVLFDSENMKITNVAAANRYLYRDYRPGWEL